VKQYNIESIPLHLIHRGSAMAMIQILAIMIITMEMSFTRSCTVCQVHIILDMGGTSSYPSVSIVSLVHTYHELGIGIPR
jgi:hypothetical protein